MRAILFDFDGTLINSEPIITRFMQDIYARKGIDLSNRDTLATQGMSMRDFALWLREHKNIAITTEDVTLSEEHLEAIPVIPGVKAALALLKAQGFKIALVTNSPRPYVDWMLRHHNMESYFDATITEDEALVAKPDPRMLEMACKQLHIPYTQCVMVDDNLPGIIAGNALGMMTVRIGEKEKATYGVASVVDLPNVLDRAHFTPR